MEIKSRTDLAKFIHQLASEAADVNCEWQNNNLSNYLEAMASWINDMDGYFLNKGENVPDQPTWKTIAEILKASTVYE